jgi:alpha-glucoside transport system substrate-binding protein
MKTKAVFTFVLIALMLPSFTFGAGHASGQPPADPIVYLPLLVKDPPPAGPELTNAYRGMYSGANVTMIGPFTGNDAVNFNNSVHEFEQQTGINIQYMGYSDFDTEITTRLNNGTPPDIADFNHPGLLATFAKNGKVLDLGKIINPAWLSQNYNQSWLDMATMPGATGPIIAGVWARANGKDLVWYPKPAFDAAGYQVPQTWDELMALTDQIANAGSTPWCIGIASGTATGWPATDWIEALMLRTGSLQNYDNWVNGTLKFDSTEVRTAINYMTNIWFIDEYVYGGRAAISTTSFIDVQHMFDNPPKCWLNKQASFITSFFPSGLVAGKDYDFFYLPTIIPALGKPFEVVGDIYAAFNDRPEVRAVIQYFTLGVSLKTWIQAGGVIAPQKDALIAWYPDPVSKKIAQTIQQATSLRFDGSDFMLPVVGLGTFFTQITAYVSGTISLTAALDNIDASWPH